MLLKKLKFLESITALLILTLGLHFLAYLQSKPELQKKEVQTTITYCNFDLSSGWKLANLTFNSLYSFSVNEKGEVVDIKKIRDDFIGEEAVKSCLSKWRITGVPEKSSFVVYFNWQHGKGWVEQTIFGKGFKQTMSVENVGY
ncbi:MAG: hypothetical protein D6687_09500 [Acidobacteria bacterium]|jgi:hypothetical protein|nr:MAG: hypothetical protein D6687_09500 [Acidobacteriota bacterium]GIU81260.1 MAG: hypothetical protein KatS3mg006_0324 [Pyrinomonadaceae bacterium]